jgi:2-polyprenyl-6-methoxyphenol hydroxylase-like FAD-dependent oxidoreductase
MPTPATFREPARELPVLGEWDVIVCGGGPAGCAAAVASARHGAKTLLLEKDGYLGGAAVSQLVCVILSTNGVDFQGVWHEYARGLRTRGGLRELEGFGSGQIRGAVDPECVKYVWDELLAAAGAELLHHAYASGVIVEGGVARGVFAETRAGRRALLARRLIDCTGDGAVAAAAGVPWEQGDDQGRPWAMSCTKVFRMGNVQWPADHPNPEAMARFEQELRDAVARGEYRSPILTQTTRVQDYVRGKLWRLTERRGEYLSVMSRVLKVDPLDPFDFTRAEREGRQQAWECADACRRFAPGFEHAYLLDTSAQLGLRSSRRIRGLATVTAQDAHGFHKYPDGIARSSWNIDIWPADSYTAPAVPYGTPEHNARKAQLLAGEYFDIRYGCLVAAGVDNLLLAGRCLSAEHAAESSLRIQQTCMATGQAAGTAAALSLKAGVTPRELDPQAVVRQLAAQRAAVTPAF